MIGDEALLFGQQLTLKFGVPFREGPLNGSSGAGLFFRRHEGQGRLVQQFLLAVSRHVLDTTIPSHHVALAVEGEHDIGGRLHDILEIEQRLQALVLNVLALRDIPNDATGITPSLMLQIGD